MSITGSEFSVEQQVGISLAVIIAWSALNAVRVDEIGWLNRLVT